jgi:TorA maturation chaperone TorD
MAAELGIACSNDFSLSELDQEYMDLFVVPAARYVAPYESVFRDEWPLPAGLRPGSNPAETGRTVKGLLMGESTLQVRQCYLQAGLLPEEDLPDHIGNELLFLAHICAREAEVPPDEARALAQLGEEFRREHLLKWIGGLRQRVEERERLGYYGVALQAAELILREEAD